MSKPKSLDDILKELAEYEGRDFEGSRTYRVHIATARKLITGAYELGLKMGKSQETEKIETEFKPGYHIVPITRGEYGHISKIKEELEELEDAINQNNKIMIGCELSDIIGAVEAVANSYGYTLDDLISMSTVTKRAFENGKR